MFSGFAFSRPFLDLLLCSSQFSVLLLKPFGICYLSKCRTTETRSTVGHMSIRFGMALFVVNQNLKLEDWVIS